MGRGFDESLLGPFRGRGEEIMSGADSYREMILAIPCPPGDAFFLRVSSVISPLTVCSIQ